MISLENAYHPWVGALHTLLDSLIDWEEDELAGQSSLLDRYDTIAELAEIMRGLAERSRHAITSLPQANRHAVLLAGMTGLYLAASEAHAPRTIYVSDSVTSVMGDLMGPTLLIMKARRGTRHQAHP